MIHSVYQYKWPYKEKWPLERVINFQLSPKVNMNVIVECRFYKVGKVCILFLGLEAILDENFTKKGK